MKEAVKAMFDKKIDQIKKEKPKMCEVIDAVWYAYKDRTGGQLITMTHEDETPWSQHVKKVCLDTSHMGFIFLTLLYLLIMRKK